MNNSNIKHLDYEKKLIIIQLKSLMHMKEV